MKFSPRPRRVPRVAVPGTALALVFILLDGCGQTVTVGLDDFGGGGAVATSGDGGGGASGAGGLSLGGSAPSAGAGEPAAEAGAPACMKTPCRGKFYECGDCIDNGDGDGAIDALDPECLGPCDDDEAGFSTGLTAKGGEPCRLECYFDGDNGSGNDNCEWSQQCDPLSVAPDYPPSGESRCAYGDKQQGKVVDCEALAASQPRTCLDECLPLVPNGCDCFGCCELPSRSGEYHFIGRGRGSSGCALDALDDPSACPPCTPVPSCLNECGPCEACVGGGADPSCQSPPACESGRAACDAAAPCDGGDYCVTGCCVPAPPPR